jgi:DNA polymerase-3 subunit delta
MVTVLTGENAFALKRALDARVQMFISEHGDFAVERLDGAEASFERIQESLQSLPFLAAKKLVILRDAGLNKQFTEHCERLIKVLPETTDLIIVEAKLDKRTGYYKYLNKATAVQEFAELDESGLARWLVAETAAAGGSLAAADARWLVERVGASQQLLSNELNKLLTYDLHITRQTIELLTEATPQSKIFDLLEAAFAGNTKRALDLYQDQRAQKVDPSQIIAMLAWQLKIVALIKAAGDRTTNDIVRDAKLSPYTVGQGQRIAGRLTLAQLKRLVHGLLIIDVRSKRERIDLDEALQNYLLMLAQ